MIAIVVMAKNFTSLAKNIFPFDALITKFVVNFFFFFFTFLDELQSVIYNNNN